MGLIQENKYKQTNEKQKTKKCLQFRSNKYSFYEWIRLKKTQTKVTKQIESGIFKKKYII